MPLLIPAHTWETTHEQTLRTTIHVTNQLQLISFNALTKKGPWFRRKHAEAWRAAGAQAAIEASLPTTDTSPHTYAIIDAAIFKPTAVRYDPCNLAPVLKWAIDGMITDHGLLPDDNWLHLDGPHAHHGGIDRNNPRIEFTIHTYRKGPHAQS